jgi:hypothetical protein
MYIIGNSGSGGCGVAYIMTPWGSVMGIYDTYSHAFEALYGMPYPF